MPQGSRNLTWTYPVWNWSWYFPWCDWNSNFAPVPYHPPLEPILYQLPWYIWYTLALFRGLWPEGRHKEELNSRTQSAKPSTLVCAAPPGTCRGTLSLKHSELISSVWRQKASFMQIQGYLYLSHKAPSPSPDIYYCKLNLWIGVCLELLLIEITSNPSISLSPNGIELHKHVRQ